MGLGERIKNIVGIEGKTWEFVKPMIGYNAASITLGGAGYPIGLYHQQFLTFVEGLSASRAGNISGISGVVDALTDVMMGAITDKTRSRYGRHRRYLLWGALPFALSYIMRWTSFGISDTGNLNGVFIYYLIASLLYSSAYTVLSIPHTAMLPQVAPQYFLRAQYKIMEYVFNSVGQISSFVFMSIVLGGANMPTPSPADRGKYMWVGIILSAWFLWPPIFTFFGTKEPSSLHMPKQGLNIVPVFLEYAQVFKSRAFRQYFFMGLSNMVRSGFYSFTDQYFIQSVADRYNRFNVLNIVAGVAEFSGAPFNYMMTKNKDKQFCGKVLSPIMIIGLLLNVFVTHNTPTIILYVAAILYNFGFSGPSFSIQNIQPDVTDIDELITGQRREGVISTANLFFRKTVGSGMNFFMGNMLQFVFKYNTQKMHYYEQSARSTIGLRLSFTVFPAIAGLITHILLTKYRLTKSDHERIKELIAEKHESGVAASATAEDKDRIEQITGKSWGDMWIGMPNTKFAHLT